MSIGAVGTATPTQPFDEALLARIEDAGINASAPREQRWVDGWLLRLSPGKAKRARCIQAVAPGRLDIDAKLALCLPLFAAAGLRPYVRITPFSQPAGLDRHLADLGMVRIDDTRVMVLASLDAFAAKASRRARRRLDRSDRCRRPSPTGSARARGSSAGERQRARRAHRASPRCRTTRVLARDERRRRRRRRPGRRSRAASPASTTSSPPRRRAAAATPSASAAICSRLAAARGATVGYLQVDAANETARRIYRRLGFADGYSYHYRTPADGAA